MAVDGEEGELMRELLCDEGGLDVRGCGEENGVLFEGGEDAGGLGWIFFDQELSSLLLEING